MSIVETLGKCVEVLKMLFSESNNSDISNEKCPVENENLDRSEQNSEDEQDSEKKKQKLLTLLEERLQHILKCMIKLAIAKMSK